MQIERSPEAQSSDVQSDVQSDAQSDAQIESRLPKIEEASDRLVVNLAHKSELIVEAFPDRLPNAAELQDMTRAFGVELVSMGLLKILARISPNRYFLERVDRLYRDIQLGSYEPVSKPVDERTELCVIESVDPATPGVSWGSHVETWRSWGRRQGLTTDVIQTNPRKSLLANAEIIRRELASHPHDRRIIATYGQGGAEFRLLLEQLLKNSPAELDGIQMWINVAGLVRGSSAITRMRKSLWDRKTLEFSSFLRGWSSATSRQLVHTNPRLRAEPELQGLPFVCVSMVGFPALQDIPVGHKGMYRTLSAAGPNDGLATFHESILRPGYIVPVPGMSHRAEAEKLGAWFQAVIAAAVSDGGTKVVGNI